MKDISISTVKKITLVVILALMTMPVALTFFLRNYIMGIFSAGCFIVGFTGLMIVYNKDRYLLFPFKFKKWILVSLILKIVILSAKLFKINIESIMQYFIFLNNRLNPEISGKKLLLLLPRCIQNADCSRDIALDINNCLMCGKCQVADIIKIAGPKKIDVRLVGGGTLALEKIKKLNPEGIVAVACERELIDGIKETFDIPVWAMRNLRPNGPCLNTKIQLDELEKVLAPLIQIDNPRKIKDLQGENSDKK